MINDESVKPVEMMILKTVVLLALVLLADAFVSPFTEFALTPTTRTSKLCSSTLEFQYEAVALENEIDSTGHNTMPCPGLDENDRFTCDESVQFWHDFQIDGVHTAQQNLQSLSQIPPRLASKGPEAIRYWLRHAGRISYFAANAVLGTLGYEVHDRLVGSSSNNVQESDDGDRPPKFLSNMNAALATRLFLEAALCFEQDYEQIAKGVYGEPWDMAPDHRQSSPQNLIAQTSRFVRDSIGVLTRRNRVDPSDKEVDTSGTALADYPDYYKNAFHYQKNGWMSKESAEVYEVQTETLFLGRQDAMQRTALPPLLTRNQVIQESSREEPMKVLEIACGTGRFMTFARENLPLDAEYTAIDLSPYYLDVARDNDAYWRKNRQQREEQDGTFTKSNKRKISPARVMQAKAESLPFEDNSFDAVVCVYLFHEIPHGIRELVAAEMARVVRPCGGTVILADSIQRGDRPILDEGLSNFGNFNEPHYISYIQDRLPDMFEQAGLVCETKSVRSSTKCLSFSKP